MRRRDFISLIGGAAVAVPLAAPAERARPPDRNAHPWTRRGQRVRAFWQGLRQGLRALGHGDEDITIEIRGAEGRPERLPDLAAELVRLAPEVIVALGPAAAQAAKEATSTTPIVMVDVADPVAAGFVGSLPHLGKNITGLTSLSVETVRKRLQLLKTAPPGAKRIAILFESRNAGNLLQLEAARQAAPTLGVELIPVEVSKADEIDSAIATITRERADAFLVPNSGVFFLTERTIRELAMNRKLPAIYQDRRFVAAGGLMSYGTDLEDLYRHAAVYVDKILKGEKRADLPVEQPTKFELVINLKTAKELGLTIPPSILARADEVIECGGAISLARFLAPLWHCHSRLLLSNRARSGDLAM
jgi:putative ABC transport system substrate-binding protein